VRDDAADDERDPDPEGGRMAERDSAEASLLLTMLLLHAVLSSADGEWPSARGPRRERNSTGRRAASAGPSNDPSAGATSRRRRGRAAAVRRRG
jgi:hypothetical protein